MGFGPDLTLHHKVSLVEPIQILLTLGTRDSQLWNFFLAQSQGLQTQPILFVGLNLILWEFPRWCWYYSNSVAFIQEMWFLKRWERRTNDIAYLFWYIVWTCQHSSNNLLGTNISPLRGTFQKMWFLFQTYGICYVSSPEYQKILIGLFGCFQK